MDVFIRTVILAFFLLVMAMIGIIVHKKITNASDFLLGGGKIGGIMTAFAYGTTYFSAVVFIGYGGTVSWGYGLSSIWIGIGNALIGTMLAWLVLARRTYDAMHRYEVRTLPEYFQKRYSSTALRIAAAVIIFVFLIPYSASVYTGLGLLFERVFNIDQWVVVLAMGVLTAAYLTLGGYLATAINDFIQGILMLAGITLIVILVVTNPEIGGISGAMAELAAQSVEGGPQLNSAVSFNPNLIALILMTSFGTWGLPQMAHKFHTIKDRKSIKKATIASTLFALIIGGGSYFMGTFGRVYMNGVMPEQGSDAVVPLMLEKVLMPQGIFGDILFGVLAVVVLSASMSTLAAVVLTSSSAVSLDLVKGVLKPDMESKKTLALMRGLCVVFVAVSIAITLKKIDLIVNMMSYSWGAVAGSFMAPYIYGMYWKGFNKAGAWTGIAAALTLTLGGLILNFSGLAAIPAPNIGAASMAGAMLLAPVGSLIARKRYPAEEPLPVQREE